MMRETAVMHEGLGVPFVYRLSGDNKHLTIRVFVPEQDLPKTYDERKKALQMIAFPAFGSVASEFNLDVGSDAAKRAISVEFVSIEQLVRNKAPKPYAEYTNGELIFH
jgi:hypothetical protein